MSKLSTLIGFTLGFIIIFANMRDTETGEMISAFLNWKALLVVLGGTFAAAFINYPLSQMIGFFKSFGRVFVDEVVEEDSSIRELLRLSKVAHKKGLLALEKELEVIEDSFLQFSVSEMLVYIKHSQLKSSLNNRLTSMRLRHLNDQDVFNNMATYAPAFGMMGTVMGLILMMTSQVGMENAEEIVDSQDMLGNLLGGMGLALVTTFYGVLLANLVFTPMAGKLRILSDGEVAKNERIIEGVMFIKESMPTSFLKEYLLSNTSEKTKLKIELFAG